MLVLCPLITIERLMIGDFTALPRFGSYALALQR